MKETGIKQGFLARKCGYDQKQFSSLINGHKTVTDNDILKFCKGFGVTPDSILCLTDTG
jgi:plasmid maintenance system antidote protein VapI